MNKFFLAITVVLAIISGSAFADLADDLSDFVGWQVIHSGTVTGYINGDGEKSEDFEGCEYGRKIVLDDSYIVTCNTYSYSYSYRPSAVILSNGYQLKLIVEDDEYDVSR